MAMQDSDNVVISSLTASDAYFGVGRIVIPSNQQAISSGVGSGNYKAIEAGSDSASFSSMSNINITSWNGIGFCTVFSNPVNGIIIGAPAVYINTRNGTINAKGPVQSNGVNLTSDWNEKEDVTIINPAEALEKITSMDAYTFKYKQQEGDRKTAGVLAQELDMVIPDLCIVDTENDKLNADYMGLIGYLVAANRGLLNRIEILEKTMPN